jgi:hypothetical protein
MKIAQFLKSVILAVAVSVGISAGAAEIIYDNSGIYLQRDYESTNEFGDEVLLAGTARFVTEFQLEMYAQFVPNGTQFGRLRFYQNTGPNWRGNPDYPTPASPPLYEQTFQISTGFQVIVVEVPNVLVPDHFTWTVQFLGISQTSTNDRAGVLNYDPPSIGQSFDDFWELLPSGWEAVGYDDVKDNYGARIVAVASAAPRLTITKSGNNVVISWPAASGNFTLESKADLNSTTWGTVGQTPTVNGVNLQVVLPIGSGNQFFRLKSP